MDGAPLNSAQTDLLGRIQSPSPTRYRLRVEDRAVHVFCGFDALLYALMTARAVELEAEPPGAAPIHATLDPEDPAAPSLWLSFVDETTASAVAPAGPAMPGMPSNRCPYLHLFEDRADATSFMEGLVPELRPAMRVLSIEEAWLAARERVDRLGAGYRLDEA